MLNKNNRYNSFYEKVTLGYNVCPCDKLLLTAVFTLTCFNKKVITYCLELVLNCYLHNNSPV